MSAPARTTAATLAGPVTAGRIVEPVSPLPVDLDAHGYVEDEYFASGVAAAYRPARPLAPDGRWEVALEEEAPYATRIVVRRPAETGRFSGTVLVEWCNVSGGVEAAPDWSYLHEEILRSGHAYVAVSAQAFGVDGGTPLLDVPGVRPRAGLVGARPERYGTLGHPGDRFAFDLFSQVGRALRHGGSAPPPLGDLAVRHVLAMGESQSAFFLTTYVNAVHHAAARVYDGVLVHSRGGSAASLRGVPHGDDAVPRVVRIRDDVSVPVFMLETETDVALLEFSVARQPDTECVRTWEVAGTAHADAYMVGAYAHLLGCDFEVNRGPHHEVAQAALGALVRWVADGTAPPTAPPIELASSSPPVLARDELGNVRGGVRTPDVDAPVATLSGEAPAGASELCMLFGSTVPFDGPTLRRRYGDEDGYVAAYEAALDGAVAAGFLLAADRPVLLDRARAFVFPT